MYLLHWLAFLLCVYLTQEAQEYNMWRYHIEENYKHTARRLLELMRSYYEEANARLTQLNEMRFMYEESPYYEMGYITGEIIERYRKVLEMAQRPVRFKFYLVPDTLKTVEYVQKLYFELYHLVRMMHETPRKWANDTEFSNIEKVAGYEQLSVVKTEEELKMAELGEMGLKELLSTMRNIADTQRRREKEKKRQRKKFEKLRQAYMLGLVNDMKMKSKVYNNKWPRDYGWEIEYYW
ncbi:hypothetical protein PYW07_012577 [Mythimna separata]|uniref:Uncharacterized protein n=1 Tax=Mythimna separata TaxID=271217 RepID=A0AAD7Y884_MYTSE|nr:hypothetical protein PYW07_012577 [Mythimna separata]